MLSPARMIAELHFKATSGEAALFELRMRLCAGTIQSLQDREIDTSLAMVRDAILEHFKSALNDENVDLLKKATVLRNKMLHCEFSTARQKLNEIQPKARQGAIVQLDIAGLDATVVATKVRAITEGHCVGQQLISNTKTITLKDIFGWFI